MQYHLIEEVEGDAGAGEGTEDLDGVELGEAADGDAENVGERRDGDGDGGVGEGEPHAVLDGQSVVSLAPRRRHHERVVDADSCNDVQLV